MIAENLLVEYQAELIVYSENDRVFAENQSANFYYQIKKGCVKMYNLNENGKEFIQGLFYEGESFGEPPLFGDFKYPASAVAIADTEIYKLGKQKCMDLLKNNFEIQLAFLATLSRRLSYKAMIMKEISVHPPEHRILTFLDFLKKRDGNSSTYKLDLTRQQIADLTGLRVETVIRACKQLEFQAEIEIIKHKIYR